MKKQILLVLALCALKSAFGMENQSDSPKLMQEGQDKADNALIAGIDRGSIKQVREALNYGANVNLNNGAPLLTAVKKLSNFHIVKLLLSNGADINDQVLQEAEKAGWAGEPLNFLLAHIPVSEQKKIRARIPGLQEGSLVVLRAMPQPDMRRKIKQILVDEIVQEQMHRIIKLVGEVKSLKYLSNELNYESESYENLRKRVKNNIMRILYGAPKGEK